MPNRLLLPFQIVSRFVVFIQSETQLNFDLFSKKSFIYSRCILFFLQNETTEDMVVGWSPLDLDSCAVSEVQSVEGSIDLAVGGCDGPSLDAADFTFDFSDQQYR